MPSTVLEPTDVADVPGPADENRFERIVTMVPLCELRDHPQQKEFYGDIPASEFAALVDDLNKNGQREPIRVRTDGTILCGHQRVRAARRLGWDTIQAIVLAIDDDEALRLLVEDNLHRRQVGPVGLARLYDAIARRSGEKNRNGWGNLRDEIAERFGNKSGRTLDRFRQLLRLPEALQEVVDARILTITAGLRILKMPAKVQSKIAQDIEAGASATEVVARHLRRDAEGEIAELQKRYRQVLLGVKHFMDDVGTRLKDVAGRGLDYKDAVAVARDGIKFFNRLIVAEKKRQAECDKNMAQLFNRLNRKPTKVRRTR